MPEQQLHHGFTIAVDGRSCLAAMRLRTRSECRDDLVRPWEETLNPVIHFEMPFEDRQRMTRFYETAFGWQTKMLGEEMGNYVLALTTETDHSGPTKPGAINGGFFPKKHDWPAQYPSIVIAVDDIQQAIKNVSNAGGKVLGEPMIIPGVGQYVSITDTEGNRVSMLQQYKWHAPRS
jgi:predicted enzyme related to lactoylglutathione lyase